MVVAIKGCCRECVFGPFLSVDMTFRPWWPVHTAAFSTYVSVCTGYLGRSVGIRSHRLNRPPQWLYPTISNQDAPLTLPLRAISTTSTTSTIAVILMTTIMAYSRCM